MTDTARVDVVLEGRPGAAEVAWVLAACALLLAVLVRFDGAAARDEAHRARQALADRAAVARKPVRKPETRRAGDDSIGNAGPISLPVFSAWSAGTSPSVGHAKAAANGAAVQPALRRIVAPVSAPVVTSRAVTASSRSTPPTALLALLAGIGVLMALAGSAMITRRRR